jgi:hypothetical protein
MIPGYTWTKVALDPRLQRQRFESPLLRQLVEAGFLQSRQGRNCGQVVADFLQVLRHRIIFELKKLYPNEPPIEFLLTIPAAWSEDARTLMDKINTKAGFRSRSQDLAFMVSEAEAAALCVGDQLPKPANVSPFRPMHINPFADLLFERKVRN